MALIYTIWQAYDYLLPFIPNENRIVYELEVFHNNSSITQYQLDKIVNSINNNQ